MIECGQVYSEDNKKYVERILKDVENRLIVAETILQDGKARPVGYLSYIVSKDHPFGGK